MEIVRIEKVNLVDAVYGQLRESILSGSLPEGTRLDSENKLAYSFNVSRVVIREALQKLRSDRLIVTRQGLGTFVANPMNYATGVEAFTLTEEGYRAFIDFRRGVEYSALRLAAKAATEEDFQQIDACAEALSSAPDRASYNEADYNFHFSLIAASHNPFLENAMRANRQLIMNVFTSMNAVPSSEKYAAASHVEIADLFRQRDAEAVIELYEGMAEYNFTRLASFFSEKR